MKVLITGTAGLLGAEVWKTFLDGHELVAMGRTQPVFVPAAQWKYCDLSDAAETYNVVTRENPDLVIHCAAYNRVDQAETHPDDAYKGNSLSNRHLALACQRFDTVLMSISSDYVFDGANPPAAGYREFDDAHPISRYGESKWWGEKAVQELLEKFYIVRTAWLFGPARATWVDSVVEFARDNKPVLAASDMRSTPTSVVDLAKALLTLAESRRFGLYHLTNGGSCSRAELAQEVLRRHNMAGYRNLRVVTRSELHLPAERPANSTLENLAWRVAGFQMLRDWKEALQEHFAQTARHSPS